MSCIYKIVNKKNGKCYIGQTVQTIEARFSQHKSSVWSKRNSTVLCNAIKKYGAKNFYIKSIISGDFTKDKLDELEKFYIKHYQSRVKNGGYNIQGGGEGKDKAKVDIEEFKKDYNSFMPIVELAKKHSISTATAKRIRIREGIKLRGCPKTRSIRIKINLEEFKKDYNSFMLAQEIANKYSISKETVYRIVKREGMKLRGRVNV